MVFGNVEKSSQIVTITEKNLEYWYLVELIYIDTYVLIYKMRVKLLKSNIVL